ncbi:MAG: single-stranded-DNA-specific exonuclease RecJ [Treponema sp.]|jgi:single-stranded-DNA-specific exonuclease|nr:single-stranded-DNA-specific exonuclease RecJ [Treponema sp.]
MEWRKKAISSDSVKALAERYGCDLLTASILLRREITSGEEIRYYLENDLRYLRNPFELPGMEDAVERILAAKEEGEKILIFGDRDVDGITGTVLLADFLGRQGMDVRWRLPMGDDPYGLSIEAVEEFAGDYGTLIITVDCGISNRAEIARAAELGVGTVITDHHNPPRQLPDAQAIVNPKLEGSSYPFRNLCGCAVAYKLTSALRFAMKSEVYGQPICLLNTRPSNDAVIVEVAKLRNLAVIDTLTETVVPGMVSVTDTRLPAFLSGQQILCWDLPVQRKLLAQAFGGAAEIQMLDIAGEIGRQIPQTAGKSLFRLKEVSRIGRYREGGVGELDVLVNLFISFVQKKEGFFDEEDGSDLQLAALGTIADIMPLRDENRLIVRKGVEAMVKKPRPGLSDLLFLQDLAGRPLGTEEISWQLTPVINASGRMGSPEKAAALLLGGTAEERNRLAGEVSALNEERKKLGDKIWESAEPQARKNLDRFCGNLALAYGEGIIRGITGIIANRLSRCFNIPAVVVSLGPDKATGSLRSARNYDLSFLLDQCSDLFIDWGGHDFAAGFSMDRSNWEPFLERLAGIASRLELGPETEAVLELDAELPLSYLSLLEEDPRTKDKKDLYILRLADRFEPYGEKNRPLLFLSRGLVIADIQIMGSEGQHVKLTVDTGKFKWPAVYWNAADRINVDFRTGDTVDLVYTVNRNWFNGMETPQLMVQDIGKTGQNTGRP